MIPEIDAKRHQEMAEQGYTVFHGVFSPEEMEALAQTLAVHEQKMREELVAHGGASGISRADEITFTDHIAERDPAVKDFTTRPEFVALTTAFLGPDTDLYWNQTVFKQPEGQREFPWHQDDAYTPVDPAPYLTLWLAISDATEENGCISVLPGSHRGGLRPHVGSPIGLVGYGNDEPDQGVLAPIPAGSLIAFWSLTLHKSGANRSKDIRKAYVIQYCKAGTRIVSSGEELTGLIPVARGGQPVA